MSWKHLRIWKINDREAIRWDEMSERKAIHKMNESSEEIGIVNEKKELFWSDIDDRQERRTSDSRS